MPAKIILDLIPKVYDTPRIVRVLGLDGEADQVEINAINAANDVTVGRYDVSVTAGPSYTTQREEAASQMIELLRAFPDAAPVIGDLVAKNLDWPGADDIAMRLKAMLPPQIQALEKNENHVPSMLLLADHLVDAEEYAEAEKTLARALKVNPWHPEAWAYRAVLAHLRNDPAEEADARDKALRFWSTNPGVDHLIGRKLSQNYRFAEGAARQRQALEFNTEFLPARIHLAEDLLRLGDEGDGWELAEEVHKRDGYDVTAYNLVTLRGTMQKFARPLT